MDRRSFIEAQMDMIAYAECIDDGRIKLDEENNLSEDLKKIRNKGSLHKKA